MSSKNWTLDNDESYLERFDPMHTDRKAHRAKTTHPRKARRNAERRDIQFVAENPDQVAFEAGVKMTYRPSKHEGGWLVDSLRTFYDQTLIQDVLALVKGGKEANVYRCEADPQTGSTLLAAKVYRPRMFRNLRNDKMYRDGREVLTETGKTVKGNDHRTMRALNKKTDFGVQVAHTSWLMYEYTTLQQLHAAGADVPQPFASGENAILMTYYGNEAIAAPTLSTVKLERKAAHSLLEKVLHNIDLMLNHNMIHGDLSAYNILYWEAKIAIIDFPQVTNSRSNSQAYSILLRDITRVCDYFTAQGVECDPSAILGSMWKRYNARDGINREADFSRLLANEEEFDDE